MSDAGLVEVCECGADMLRIWTYQRADTDEEHTAYYNVGTGIKGTKKQHRKYAAKQGFEEVGTSEAKVKPKETNYDFSDRDMREMANIINK